MSVAVDNDDRGTGDGHHFEADRISSSGGMTGSKYSSSGGFWTACWIDELRLVELRWLDNESFADPDAVHASVRSRQLSMSSYVSPTLDVSTADLTSSSGMDCGINSYKLLGSSRPVPICAEVLSVEDGVEGGSGRARLKNLLVRLSVKSFAFSSSVLLSADNKQKYRSN